MNQSDIDTLVAIVEEEIERLDVKHMSYTATQMRGLLALVQGMKPSERAMPTTHKNGYYTVVIPWAEDSAATMWHPTEREGTFSTLTRGCFPTWFEAWQWAAKSLNHCPYSIKSIDASIEEI